MSGWDFLRQLGPGWPSARGWYAAALFAQTCAILWMVSALPDLASNEFFKSLATAIVITGWVGFAVAGRDNRADLERLGQAQQLASDLLKHATTAASAAPPVDPPQGEQA